jgi:hypothetical protein
MVLGHGRAIALPYRPQGLEGSYLGVGLDSTNLDSGVRSLLRSPSAAGWVADQLTPRPNSSAAPQANERQVQGRLDLPNSPLSIRGTVVIDDDVEAVLPMLSYDLPMGVNANIYAGAGYLLVRPGEATVLGDRDGPVFNAGAETALNQRIILYGDLRYRPVTAVGEDPVRVQFGMGHRF